jgi:hypothetical protein
MNEKLMEQKWMIAVYLLIAPTLLRVFGLLTESALITVWLVVANAFFVADVAQRVLTREPTAPPPEKTE